jgi:altronate hydrolase
MLIRLNKDDNVVIAGDSLAHGQIVHEGAEALTVKEPIPYGHKMATGPIRLGSPVRKYGQTIALATVDIEAGAHVHLHNTRPSPRSSDYEFAVARSEPAAAEPRTFDGYRRSDGRIGTRNYVAVISTVNCSAATSRFITSEVGRDLLADFPNVDGVIALAHKGGCGMASDGQDHQLLNRVLGGFARHPNVGAYLFIGLGCEDAQITHLTAHEPLPLSSTGFGSGLGAVPSLVIQERGGIRKTVEAGVAALREILPEADRARREQVPASALVFGTNCGGSDAFSGITANPAVGAAADLVVAQGGSVVLGETPEIYGAEHILTRRAASREVGEALIERIRWWEWYTATFGATLNNNPSPGNKAGGLTTIAEKSLGAIAKGGTTTLRSVINYAEPVTERGLTVMDTPGFDPVSMTGIVAGGANICAFTTGRGSVYGCKPVPCLKVASNSVVFHRMIEDMDVNAGEILNGTTVQELGRVIFEELLAVASGKETKSEALGLGEDEFAPWVIGPVL